MLEADTITSVDPGSGQAERPGPQLRAVRFAAVTVAVLMVLFPVMPLVTRLLERALHRPAAVVLGVGLVKDGLLAVLLATLLWLWWKGAVRLRRRPVWAAAGLYVGWVAVYLLLAPGRLMGVYAFRGDIEPLAVLALAALLPLSREQWRRVLWAIFAVAVGVSLFGLYQALVLRFSFLHRYFSNPDGTLPHTYQAFRFNFPRATSTLTTPNHLGFYLAAIILGCVNLAIRASGRKRLAYLAVGSICFVTLLFTLSRSAWIALTVGLLITFVFSPNKTVWFVGGIACLLILSPVAWRFHLMDRVMDTITMRDPSARSRIPSFQKGIAFVKAHPLGNGLGTVGSRTQRFGDTMPLHSESYYLEMAMEKGIPGLGLYLLVVGSAAGALFKTIREERDDRRRALPVAGLAVLLGLSAAANFIPALYEIPVASYMWFFVGLGLRSRRLSGGQDG